MHTSETTMVAFPARAVEGEAGGGASPDERGGGPGLVGEGTDLDPARRRVPDVDPGATGPDGPPRPSASSFAADLCRRHGAWVIDRTTGDRLPVGWRALVEAAFAEVSTVVGWSRLALRRLEGRDGALTVELVLVCADLGLADRVPIAVGTIVARAVEASRRTCQRCGAPGRPRRRPSLATFCDAHAGDYPDASGPACPRPAAPRRRRAPAGKAPRPGADRVALYSPSDVEAALGRRGGGDGWPGDFEGDALPRRVEPETEQANHLRAILDQGEDGRWRDLAMPGRPQLAALDDVDRLAPHVAAVTSFVRRHLGAAIAMGLPTVLPPLMLLGEPGTGKTWVAETLAACLGVPVRRHPMNVATTGEGLTGAHPVWRGARPGLVARTLLAGRVANPKAPPPKRRRLTLDMKD